MNGLSSLQMQYNNNKNFINYNSKYNNGYIHYSWIVAPLNNIQEQFEQGMVLTVM
jgi:hypothetical protein